MVQNLFVQANAHHLRSPASAWVFRNGSGSRVRQRRHAAADGVISPSTVVTIAKEMCLCE
jgi:hypothetical protein